MIKTRQESGSMFSESLQVKVWVRDRVRSRVKTLARGPKSDVEGQRSQVCSRMSGVRSEDWVKNHRSATWSKVRSQDLKE